MRKKSYCLIIDSGLGGLHILAKAHKLCPNTNFLYIADDKNIPYGNKTAAQIEYSILQIYYHYKHYYNITCIVLACNTATAACINALRNKINLPIIGTEPNIKAPTSMHFKNIAILVTPLTSKSDRFNKLLTSSCHPIICENLAQNIDFSLLSKKEIDTSIIFDKIKAKNADAIVLGCTHYNFIAPLLKNLNLPIFDSIDGVSKQIRVVTSNLPCGNGNVLIFTTSRNPKLQNAYIKYYRHLLI